MLEKVEELQVELPVGKLVCPFLTVTFPAGARESALGSKVVFMMKSHVTACMGAACAVYDRSRSCCGMIPREPVTAVAVTSRALEDLKVAP